eukprot:474750-Rhodomonas_salina.2
MSRDPCVWGAVDPAGAEPREKKLTQPQLPDRLRRTRPHLTQQGQSQRRKRSLTLRRRSTGAGGDCSPTEPSSDDSTELLKESAAASDLLAGLQPSLLVSVTLPSQHSPYGVWSVGCMHVQGFGFLVLDWIERNSAPHTPDAPRSAWQRWLAPAPAGQQLLSHDPGHKAAAMRRIQRKRECYLGSEGERLEDGRAGSSTRSVSVGNQTAWRSHRSTAGLTRKTAEATPGAATVGSTTSAPHVA